MTKAPALSLRDRSRLNNTAIKKIWDKIRKRAIYIFAFFLPAALLLIAYFCFGVYPFGDESALVLDLNGQYVYYYEHLRDIIRGQASPFISWSRNLSGEFMGIFAYYLASPFIIIPLLLPRSIITEAVLIMQLCKVGTASVTFCFYLRHSKRLPKKTAFLFSVMYSLMSYMIVQLMNPMWLDGLIYLPLIVFGLERLIDKGKMLNFVIPLALMFAANFYIGWMIAFSCILYFLYYIIAGRNEKFRIKHFFTSGLKFAAGGILAAVCAAVVLLPLVNSLQLGKFEFTDPKFEWETQFDFIDFFRNLLPNMYDTCRPEGSPSVYCGVLALVLLPMYFMNSRIRTKNKIGVGFLMLAIVLSMYVSNIDIAWHGFQKPNWLPYRYCFTFCFVMLCAAADCFKNIKGITFKAIGGTAALLIAYVLYIDKQHLENAGVITAIWFSILFIAAYGFVLYRMRKNRRLTSGVMACLCVLLSAEMFASTLYTLYAIDDDVNYSKRNPYKSYISIGRETVKDIKEYDDGIYRIESDYHRTVNDALALGSYGISHSSSTLNAKPIQFLRRLGFSYGGHYIKYRGATYVTDALFGIKYVMERAEIKTDEDGNTVMPDIPESTHYDGLVLTKTNDKNQICVYENPYALPIGYMIDSGAENCSFTGTEYPFENQNKMLSSMLGTHKDFFRRIGIDEIKSENAKAGVYGSHARYTTITEGENSQVEFYITAPNSNMLYMYLPSKYERKVNLWLNKDFLEYYFEGGNMTILPLGRFDEGEQLQLITTIANDKNEVLFQDEEFVYLDEELFKDAVNTLKQHPLEITDFKEDHIKGTITADTDGIMFTSITNEPGWKVWVDGVETEITELYNALIGVKLTAGTHSIEMKFTPPGFYTGLLLTVLGICTVIVIGIFEKTDRKKAAPAEGAAEAATDDPETQESPDDVQSNIDENT